MAKKRAREVAEKELLDILAATDLALSEFQRIDDASSGLQAHSAAKNANYFIQLKAEEHSISVEDVGRGARRLNGGELTEYWIVGSGATNGAHTSASDNRHIRIFTIEELSKFLVGHVAQVKTRQSAHASREEELRQRVLAVAEKAGWHVENEVYSSGSLNKDLMIINYGEKLVAIEVKNSLTSNAFGAFLRRATATLNPRFKSEGDYRPDEYWGISYEVAASMMPNGDQIRVFSIEEFEWFASSSLPAAEAAEASPRRAASRMVANAEVIQVLGIGLLSLIEERIAALNAERPNSDGAREELRIRIAEYEKLKSEVEIVARAATDLKAGKIKEPDAAKISQAFSEGLEKWWKKKHAMVLDVGVFTMALSICSLAGSGGWLTATALAGLVGGKKLTDALKGTKKGK